MHPQGKHIGGYFMRYTDFIKTQNKKALSLLEREDKQAGSPPVKPVVRGNVDAGVGAPVPAITRPVTEARAAVIVGSRIGLTQAQQREASLVSKLPSYFPIERWESMNTKAQLKAIRSSGLNVQDQWVLLNATTNLSDLDAFNRITAGSKTITLNPNANVPRGSLSSRINHIQEPIVTGNTSKSTSLQKEDSDEQSKNREIAARLAARIKRITTPGPTPSPNATPLPQPGASPFRTPVPEQVPIEKKTSSPNPLPLPPGVNPSTEEYTWYNTYQQAANAWAKDNVSLSKDRERCALIYRNIDEAGNERYTLSNTYAGMKAIPALSIRDNVALQFIWLRYLERKIPDSSIVGFIHTHPEPPKGITYTSFSDEDLSLNEYGIEYSTIVPYETGEPQTRHLSFTD